MEIGFIGAGKMATSLISGLLRRVDPFLINVHDRDAIKLGAINEFGVNIHFSPEELIDQSEIIVLTIKPENYKQFLLDYRENLKKKIVVTISSGISNRFMYELLGHKNFVRVAPNSISHIGHGVTCICENNIIDKFYFNNVVEMFRVLGEVEVIKNDYFEIVAPISGVSPTYNLLYINSLIRFGLSKGMHYDMARKLAAHAVITSGMLLLETDEDIDDLIKELNSYDSTTKRSIEHLKVKGFDKILRDAMELCYRDTIQVTKDNDELLKK